MKTDELDLLVDKILKDDDYLAHYGVLGMKWGQRRARSKGKSFVERKKDQYSRAHEKGKVYQEKKKELKKKISSSTKAAGKKIIDEAKEDKRSPDAKTKAKLKKKKLNQMSNEEIRALTNRLELEKRYKDLNKSKVSKGSKIVSEIVSSAAKESAKRYVSRAINSMISETVKLIIEEN